MQFPSFSIWQRHLPIFWVGLLSEVILWSGLLFVAYHLGDRFVDWLELPFATGSQTLVLYFNDVSQLGSGSPVRWPRESNASDGNIEKALWRRSDRRRRPAYNPRRATCV